MKKFMKTKAGVVLVGFSVLAVWMLLVARPVLAQRVPTAPSCPSGTTLRNLTDGKADTTPNFVDDVVIDNAGSPKDSDVSDGFTHTLEAGNIEADDPGTTDTNESVPVNYFRITVPALTVGELTVQVENNSSLTRPVVRLCKGSSTIVTDPVTSDADDRAPNSSRTAGRYGPMMEPVTPGDYFVVVRGQDTELTDGSRIDSQTETAEMDGTTGTYTLDVTFHGVMPETADTSDKGSFGTDNELHTYEFIASMPGLLTVETTGNTNTVGELLDNSNMLLTEDKDSGTNNNFEIISAVNKNGSGENFTVTVQGQSATERGDYTLAVDFKIAAETISDLMSKSTMEYAIEDGTEYFHFQVGNDVNTFLTVETNPVDTAKDTNTKGTLFGKSGKIAEDSNSGVGNNFRIHAPVSSGDYIVQVDRESGSGNYTLMLSSPAVDAVNSVGIFPPTTPTTKEMSPPSTGDPVDVHYYSIDVPTTGILQVQTVDVSDSTPPDTTGVLYGPDGKQLARDEDSGDGAHFKITLSVEDGQHVVAVAAADRMTSGSYQLKVAFVEGTDVEVPTTPVPEPDEPDPTPPVGIDPTGHLDEPPHNGTRSGIGLVRGWACAAPARGVEIRISNTQGQVARFFAPHGSARGDVDVSEHCGIRRRSNPPVGFAAQFNYNNLLEGTYTIEAFVGREQVGQTTAGQTNTFEVVHISDEEFLEGVSREVTVENFPFTGDTTVLEWDQPSQNFQIVDPDPE